MNVGKVTLKAPVQAIVMKVDDRRFVNVQLRDVVRKLTSRIRKFNTASCKSPTTMAMTGKADDTITWESLAFRYAERYALKPGNKPKKRLSSLIIMNNNIYI
jgi:hypothetical protein